MQWFALIQVNIAVIEVNVLSTGFSMNTGILFIDYMAEEAQEEYYLPRAVSCLRHCTIDKLFRFKRTYVDFE